MLPTVKQTVVFVVLVAVFFWDLHDAAELKGRNRDAAKKPSSSSEEDAKPYSSGTPRCNPPCGVSAECGSRDLCVPICGVDHSTNRKCGKQSIVGCFCKNDGHIFADGHSQRCIPKTECKPPKRMCQSARNMTFNLCGSPCGDPHCSKPTRQETCPDQCIKRCGCLAGQKKNAKGNCVNEDECEKVPKSLAEYKALL